MSSSRHRIEAVDAGRGSLGDGRPGQRSFMKGFVPTASSHAMRTCGVRPLLPPEWSADGRARRGFFEGRYANVTGKEW